MLASPILPTTPATSDVSMLETSIIVAQIAAEYLLFLAAILIGIGTAFLALAYFWDDCRNKMKGSPQPKDLVPHIMIGILFTQILILASQGIEYAQAKRQLSHQPDVSCPQPSIRGPNQNRAAAFPS